MVWWKYVIIVLTFPAYKLIINVLRYQKTIKLEAEYIEHFTNGGNTENYAEIVDLFKKAGISSPGITYTEPVGFGLVNSANASVFDNIYVHRKDIVGLVSACFDKAKSEYRKRAKDAVNPLYWLDTALHLPAHVLEYLGAKPDHIAGKILNVIYWVFLCIVAAVRSGFIAWIKQLISQIGV